MNKTRNVVFPRKILMEIKSKYFQSNIETMDKQILTYLNQLEPPIDIDLPGKNAQWLCPLKNPETCRCTQAFYSKYYSDTNERILILGINPGRFGSGTTGRSMILFLLLSREIEISIVV
jgi:hypothetical protein